MSYISYLLKSFVNHGFTGSFHFLHFIIATNAKINGLGAALACASISSMSIVMQNRSDFYNIFVSTFGNYLILRAYYLNCIIGLSFRLGIAVNWLI